MEFNDVPTSGRVGRFLREISLQCYNSVLIYFNELFNITIVYVRKNSEAGFSLIVIYIVDCQTRFENIQKVSIKP